MKTLQNNFTTPEQSKRLLELGVPADSANCYYLGDEIIIRQTDREKQVDYVEQKYIPCWSVGRLIEITTICREGFEGQKYHSYTFQKDISPLEKAIEKIEIAARENQIDFSKLED